VIHFGRDDFLVAGLEDVRAFFAAFFCRRGKRTAFFVTGFATSCTVGFSAVIPNAPATVPTVEPIVLATVTSAPSVGSGTFFFCGM
jgi:hypothetical protein